GIETKFSNLGKTAALDDIASSLASFTVKDALEHIWSEIQKTDEKITQTEPFKLVKTDAAAAKAIIQELVHELRHIAAALQPFMPETSQSILEAIKEHKKPENLFARLENYYEKH